MASIPLPALHIQPPPDTSNGIERALAMRDMLMRSQIMQQEASQRQALMPGQIQAQQQALQSGALDLKMRQQQMEAWDIFSRALQESRGGKSAQPAGNGGGAESMQPPTSSAAPAVNDLVQRGPVNAQTNDLVQRGPVQAQAVPLQNGRSPGGMEAVFQRAIDMGANPQFLLPMQENYYKFVKEKAAAGSAEIDFEQKQVKHAFSGLRSIETAKAEDRPALWQNMLPELQALGQRYNTPVPEQYPGDEQLPRVMSAMHMYDAALADSKAQAEAAEAGSKAVTAGQSAETATAAGKAFQGLPLTPRERALLEYERYGKTHTTVSTDNLGFTTSSTNAPPALPGSARRAQFNAGQGGGGGVPTGIPPAGAAPAAPASQATGKNEDYLRSIPPAQQELVKGIASYDIDPTRMMLRYPRIMDAVKKYDPTYDQGLYGQIQAARKEFETGGRGAQNMRSLNTLVHHLANFRKATEDLDNSWSPTYNTVANFLSKHTGSPKVDNYRYWANAVAGEMATMVKGGVGSDEEIKAWRDRAGNEDMSKDAMHAVLDSAFEMAAGRLNAVATQYLNAMHGKQVKGGVLTPQSRAILEKLPGGQSLLNMDALTEGVGKTSGPSPTRGGLSVGQTVTIKGKQMTVTAVHPDGSFDAK